MKGCSSRIVPPHTAQRHGSYATQGRWRVRRHRQFLTSVVFHEANDFVFRHTPCANRAYGGFDESHRFSKRHIEPLAANAPSTEVLLEVALDSDGDLSPGEPPEAMQPELDEVARLNARESVARIHRNPDLNRRGAFGRNQVEAMEFLLLREPSETMRAPHRTPCGGDEACGRCAREPES